MPEVIVSFCTCPNKEEADKIARLLVENKLAACVNILPNLTSVYSWQGQIETSHEHLLIIKSLMQSYELMQTMIREHHPYEVPEIIAVPVEKGLPDYINWIYSCLTEK